MSDFGLSIAASGLIADSAELDTASNNLSNINTPGYAQEVVNLAPEAAAGPLQAGRGVTVASVSELTDAVYESANVAAEGVQGAANDDEPGDDLHRGRLPRTEQRRPLGAALDVLERSLDAGRQPQPGRRAADRRRRRQRSGPGAQHHLDAALRPGHFAAIRGRDRLGGFRDPGPGQRRF